MQASANAVAVRSRQSSATDLCIVLVFFLVCYTTESALDPLLRRGGGLQGVLALAAYQFMFEGFAPLFVLRIRRERFADYGFTRHNLGKSVALALILAVVNDLVVSWNAGALLWVPLRRQAATRMSLAVGVPWSLLGLAATVAVWGFFEAFFGVFFAKKLNQALEREGRGWWSLGAAGFALFNGLIHLTVHQGISGFLASFASGYAIAVIPGLTGNAWGSALFQTVTNAVGGI